MARPAADMVLYAPSGELADQPLTPNAAYGRQKRPAKPRPLRIEEEGVSLYNGYDGFLVRTVLLRSDAWQEQSKAPPVIKGPEDIYELCRHLALHDQEHFVVIALSPQNKVKAIYEAAIGGTSSAAIELMHVVKIPVLTGATGVVAVHNHPGGDPAPSKEDRILTVKMKQALDCLGLHLLDHLIVASGGFYSFVSEGAL